MKSLLILVGLLLLTTKGNALDCYSCTNCLPSFLSSLEDQDTCGALQNTCYKEIEDDGSVNRGCSDTLTCTGKDVLPGRCDGDSVKPCYICCTDDLCNSSAMISVSMVTMILSITATILTRYI